ncbi:MAG: hypothetical protein HC788_13330, partial [Sphingopyxis sp.]|nr:hypothetical protein [Sphingopyxis sp.]
MLTFAISLLFTLGAAFSLLVIVGMIAGNWGAIRSALAGEWRVRHGNGHRQYAAASGSHGS